MSKKTSKPKKVTERELHDRDKIREQYLESPHMDWTRFAEERGWHALQSRARFPVKTWQEEKRRILSEKQTDILSGLIFERRFKWTHAIIETLDRYPKAIDMGLSIAEAKMGQVGSDYKAYTDYLKSKQYEEDLKSGKPKPNPLAKVSMTEISMLLKGMKDVTEAKMKALMLDKWAVSHLELSNDEMNPPDHADGTTNGHRITIEGKSEVRPEDFQQWFDEWIDRPALPAKKVEPK